MLSINLLCLILNPMTSQEETIEELCHLDQLGWEDLLTVSRQHGVESLVYSKLKRLSREVTIPTGIQATLRQVFLSATRRNMLVLHQAGTLLNAIKAAEIDVIGLKGIYLVENIYQAIGHRSFCDVDMLVRNGDLQLAIECLEALGYRLSTYFDVDDENIDIKHVPPMTKANGLSVEIHWTILDEDKPFLIDVQGLWARALPARIAGVDALALSPEDLVLHLCLHLTYQHHLKLGLRGLYDITLALRHFDGQLNWEELIKIAQAWGAERVAWLSLTLAADLLGAEIPDPVLAQLHPANIEPWVLASARSQLMERGSKGSLITPDMAQLASEKGIFKRIRLIISRIFLPKTTLARIYNVPPNSLHIYGCYFRRLRGLIRSYAPTVRSVFNFDQGVIAGVEKEQAIKRLKLWMVE